MTLKILGSEILSPSRLGISWFPYQEHWAVPWRSLRFDDSSGFQIGGNGVNFHLIPKGYAKLFGEGWRFGWVHRVNHMFIVIDPAEVKTVLGKDIMVVNYEFLKEGFVLVIQVIKWYLLQENLLLFFWTWG